MRSYFPFHRKINKSSGLILVLSIFTILGLAGSLSGCGAKTPSPSATAAPTKLPTVASPSPSPTPMDLPPALVEADPMPGAQITLNNSITFYFNQPMDQLSVEGAISGQPELSGSFTWQDDSSLTFTPDAPFEPGSALRINIDSGARSSKGMPLIEPIQLSYTIAGYLSLVQELPANDASDIDPTSAIMATFNQPVVPLGADPASLPAGFTLTPSMVGSGEWLNTSTYIYHAEPALAGGEHYRVSINPDLTSTSGAPLESAPEWSFNTVLPRLVSSLPAEYSYHVRLDTNIQLNFSYSMDTASVETYFSLTSFDGTPVSGQASWNEDFTTFTFTPAELLQRDTTYVVSLGAEAAALGGTPIGEAIRLEWYTVPELSISGTEPSEGGAKLHYEPVRLFISSYLLDEDLEEFVSFNPAVPNLGSWFDVEQLVLSLYGSFDPDTNYTLTVSPELTDLWGSSLGQAYKLHFRTGGLEPAVQFPYTFDETFLTTLDSGILAQVTNVTSIPISVGSMTLEDLAQMSAENGYDFRQNFTPSDAESWTFYPEVPRNQSTTVSIPISPDGQPRSPGLYFMKLDIPVNYKYTQNIVLAVSHYQTTLKLGQSDALVWAVDLTTNQPAPDLPVAIYDQHGNILDSGVTDVNGVFQTPITAYQDPYDASYAVLGELGKDNFGFAMAYWSQGVSPWDFDIPVDYSPTSVMAYIYTDRPIYRPGDTVYFRMVVRQASNGRYSLPEISSYPLVLNDTNGQQLATFDLPLSGFGTAHGEYTLPSNAIPGYYWLHNPDEYIGVSIEVANYRKPEINLQVTFQDTDVISGTSLLAEVNARYFFDAPAGNMPVHWVLYRKNAYFNIPNYQVGPVDTDWLDVYSYDFGQSGLGRFVSEGDGKTDSNGILNLELTPPSESGRQEYTLEATIIDESGLPTSARSSIYVNPAEYYIGVHPDAWSYQAKSEAGFDVLVADWNGDPAGERTLAVQFQRVKWVRQDPPPDTMGYQYPTFEPVYTPIASSAITTDAEGKARVSFTPPEPGTYQLDVSGDGTLTQLIVWVAGSGVAEWPALPNQRLRLVADQDAYAPGDTAQIFVPNPFGRTATGLMTVERGAVMRYFILYLEPGGSTIPVALSNEDAPNVYIAVTLLGQDDQDYPDFRQGYVNLPIDVSFEFVTIDLTSQPERTGPGEPVKFSMRITDANGDPVEGEFSLSVVDLAVLSLTEPNAEDILTAFYGQQPLGVRTGTSLAASGQRMRFMQGGMGGGGGDEALSVAREYFPDTAYWEADIVTDSNGEATVSMHLPDSLTTWQVLVRGLTKDTLVGETQLEVITTKELLVRPVTPRFLVAGDHAMLAAVVQNNNPESLDGSVTLKATGFELDDPDQATQPVTIQANGQTRVEWWGTTPDVKSADLLFSVQAGDLRDAVRIHQGALPVLRYTARQTFATSGSMLEGGQQLELVSLPVTFDADSGSLEIELDPSMVAGMLDALEAVKDYPYDCTEPILSSFLPNLVTYTTLQTFGIDSPDLEASLEQSVSSGLDHLLSMQNADGGWGWCAGSESDSYLSSYVLFGLATARDADFTITEEVISKARDYISANLITPSKTTETWQLDRLAFENFALVQSGTGNLTSAKRLYAVRDQLNPWAIGFLALTLDSFASTSQNIPTMISNLQATAIRSATGVHWELETLDWRNMTTTLSNSAIVLYTLAQLEPDSTLIPDVVNYLMSNRNTTGCWNSSYENTWILLAMDEVLKVSGELNSDYGFNASVNGALVASGQAGGETQLNPVTASVPVSDLYLQDPNALIIQRESGTGRLYYTAALTVYRPIEDAAPIDQGISVSRVYYPAGVDLKSATPIESTQVGDSLTARLTIVVPTDVYNFVVEDYIPAGTEILNTNLKTSQLGEFEEPGPLYDPREPFSRGWGWWLFDPARIYDDRISWTASYLPAGTYDLTYTLVILLAGEYRILPAHAWMFYFPEVQGNSAGEIMEIKP